MPRVLNNRRTLVLDLGDGDLCKFGEECDWPDDLPLPNGVELVKPKKPKAKAAEE